jgi:hypothetical protein
MFSFRFLVIEAVTENPEGEEDETEEPEVEEEETYEPEGLEDETDSAFSLTPRKTHSW